MSDTNIVPFTFALDHALDSHSPPIVRDNIDTWKGHVAPEAKQHFRERYAELQRAAEALVREYDTNRLLYESAIGFTPIVGHIYYLYEPREGRRFLSLVKPQHASWSGYLGAYRLNVSYVWETVTEEKS